MVYLNRLFWSFVMLLHTEFVAEVNSTGDISYTEMSVVLQPRQLISDSYSRRTPTLDELWQ